MAGTTKTAAQLRREQARRIRAQREELRITQHDLAASVGVSKQAVSQWERGVASPSPVLQVALAQRLEKPWVELFGLDDGAVA